MATPNAIVEGRWTEEAIGWQVHLTPVEAYDDADLAPRLDSYELALLLDVIERVYGQGPESCPEALPAHVRHLWQEIYETLTDRG